jgi:hypothetical protein
MPNGRPFLRPSSGISIQKSSKGRNGAIKCNAPLLSVTILKYGISKL